MAKQVPLNKKLCVISEEYVFPNQTIFSLERQKVFALNNKYTVKDEKNKDVYVCKLQQRGQNSIKNMNGNNIIRFDSSFVRHFDLTLYSSNNNTGKNIQIKHHISLGNSRYTFEIFNKTTGKNEEFEVYRSSFCNMDIYLGKKKEGGMLICKTERTRVMPNCYKVVIEPNIDTIFTLTIIFYFLKLFQRRATTTTTAAGAATAIAAIALA